jgi:hypothetical protein
MTAQRGMATVAITLAMAFVILLSVAFAHRSVLFEAKASTNQYRAAQAHEAAEAGADWALAQLNSNTPIGDDCLASSEPAAIAFRERSVALMRARCVQGGNGWSCQCSGSGSLALDGSIAFSVVLNESNPPGVLQLTSTGASGNSRSEVQLRLGRLPGLDTQPAAALTVRGSASFSAGSFEITHTSTDGAGVTVHSGGTVDASTLRLLSTPGTPASTSLVGDDSALAQLTPQGLFASVFRMDKPTWRAQPMVHEIDCRSPCGAALAQAASGHQLLWLRGGLRLDTPVALGTPQRPVVLVVDGPIELHESVVIHGLIYGTGSRWLDPAGATIHGAVILEGDLQASGNTQIHHDAAVLAALHERTGTYARQPGSWRDH